MGHTGIMFMLGFGGWRGWLVGTLTCLGLPLLLMLLVVYAPGLNPAIVLVPVVLIPVAVLWRRETLRDRDTAANPTDRYPI
jgi:hypothetical protein